MSKIRELLVTAVWLLPASRAKNALLRGLGHAVHANATARSNLVLRVSSITLDEAASLGRWNLIKDVAKLELSAHAAIGRFNVISAHPVYLARFPGGAQIELAPHAKITSRHHLDAAGGIRIGAFASIAGHGTTILTHSIDLRLDAQSAAPVSIGERSFVGTHSLLLGGASLPARSVLAAGSVLPRAKEGAGEPGLYAGSPAVRRRAVHGAWFERSATSTRRLQLPDGSIIEDAF